MANEPKLIKILVLTTNQILISQIEEVGADIGEPDCKLVDPYVVTKEGMLEPWLLNVTREDTFMMSSDKILTLTDPTPTLLEKYEDLTDGMKFYTNVQMIGNQFLVRGVENGKRYEHRDEFYPTLVCEIEEGRPSTRH